MESRISSVTCNIKLHLDPWLLNGPMRHPLPPGAMALTTAILPAMGTGGLDPSSTNAPLREVGRIRHIFPETWLWSNATLGFVKRL